MSYSVKDEIDAIMEEMEAKTPKPSAEPTQFVTLVDEKIVKIQTGTADDIDAKGYFSKIVSNIVRESTLKPGKLHPSRPTNEKYYDTSHRIIGLAIIFNQRKFKQEKERRGTDKDANDLKEVLGGLGFTVKVYDDLTVSKIKETLALGKFKLYASFQIKHKNLITKITILVSRQNHSDNDCLLITIMTHGERDGKIQASDETFLVQDLYFPFIGHSCESLIGKPKLFFIQACRGSMVDPGAILKPTPKARTMKVSDQVDAKAMPQPFVIPTLSDLLIMYSTAEGYYSFRNPQDGSWFIQALCDELRENPQEDLLTILTGVNRRVAFARQSHVPDNDDWDAMKQMPNLMSMLTKIFYFRKRTLESKLEDA